MTCSEFKTCRKCVWFSGEKEGNRKTLVGYCRLNPPTDDDYRSITNFKYVQFPDIYVCERYEKYGKID